MLPAAALSADRPVENVWFGLRKVKTTLVGQGGVDRARLAPHLNVTS
jgi:hypothetical protein